VSGSHLEPMTRFLFSVWWLRVSWCVAPSLTRGWVCNLLVPLLLGLARVVTLGLNSRRTHDHILLSHLRLPQPGGPGPRIYIPQEKCGLVIPPGTGFPFVASYDSQGCGGGILTRLHMGRSPRGLILFGYTSVIPAAHGANVIKDNVVCFSEACAVISNVFAIWIIINSRYTLSDAWKLCMFLCSFLPRVFLRTTDSWH
jgi:hypothetical protein